MNRICNHILFLSGGKNLLEKGSIVFFCLINQKRCSDFTGLSTSQCPIKLFVISNIFFFSSSGELNEPNSYKKNIKTNKNNHCKVAVA